VSAIDPNRSITELKSGRSTPAFCGREVLRSLECVGQAAANRRSSSWRRLGSLEDVHAEGERNKINVMAIVAITRVTNRLWMSDSAKDKPEKERRAQEALVELEEAERLGNIKSASLLLAKGTAYKRLGRYPEALQMAMAATIEAKEAKNAFDEARSYYNCACYWTLLENIEPALKLLKQSIEISSAYRIMAEKDDDLEYLRKNATSGFRALVPDYKTNEPATRE
jgi:tetratricopeptide (TPR) repeat protein